MSFPQARRDTCFRWRINQSHNQPTVAPSGHLGHHAHHYANDDGLSHPPWEGAGTSQTVFPGRYASDVESNVPCSPNYVRGTSSSPGDPTPNAYYVHHVHDTPSERRDVATASGPAAATLRMLVAFVCLALVAALSICVVHVLLLSNVDGPNKLSSNSPNSPNSPNSHEDPRDRTPERSPDARLASLLELIRRVDSLRGVADDEMWLRLRHAVPEWWDNNRPVYGVPRSERMLLDLMRALLILSNRTASDEPAHERRPRHAGIGRQRAELANGVAVARTERK